MTTNTPNTTFDYREQPVYKWTLGDVLNQVEFDQVHDPEDTSLVKAMLNKANLETINQVRLIIGDKTHLHGDAITEPMNDVTDEIFDLLLDMAKTAAPLPKLSEIPDLPSNHHRLNMSLYHLSLNKILSNRQNSNTNPNPLRKFLEQLPSNQQVDVDFVIQETLEKHRQDIENVMQKVAEEVHGKLAAVAVQNNATN